MNTPNKKVGRPRAYTPEVLGAKFEEYVEWVKANPVYISKVSAGEIIPVPTQRPLTLVGFCQFAGISKDTFCRYEDEFCGPLSACAKPLKRTNYKVPLWVSMMPELLAVSFILPTARMSPPTARTSSKLRRSLSP